MKFSCTQENIKQALYAVSSVAGKNVTLPVLNYVFIEAKEGNKIIFTTTNLEIGIRFYLHGKVEEKGSYLVPAKLFSEVVHLLPVEKVDVAIQNQECVLTGEGVKTKIKGLPPEDFPLLPTIENPLSIHCGGKDLRRALLHIIFATSTEDIRPELSGALFWFRQKELVLVATDSYRLAEKKLLIKESVQEERRVIIPRKSLEELLRNLGEEEGDVEIRLSDNQVLFLFNHVEILSRLISGNYPDYQQIIPERSATKVIMAKDALETMVKSTSLFCKSGINDIHLRIDAKEQRLALTATSSQLGEQRMESAAEVSGDDNEIIFNYRYLLDGLKVVGADKVVLEIVNNASPGVLRPSGDAAAFLYLIMPIKQ